MHRQRAKLSSESTRPPVAASGFAARQAFVNMPCNFANGMLQKASQEMLEKGTFDFARDGMPFAKLQGMFTKA